MNVVLVVVVVVLDAVEKFYIHIILYGIIFNIKRILPKI